MYTNSQNFAIFPDDIQKELNDYRKYLKYNRNNKINIGNRNWIIIDSSFSKYTKITDELKKYSLSDDGRVYTYIDADYSSAKYGFDGDQLMRKCKI